MRYLLLLFLISFIIRGPSTPVYQAGINCFVDERTTIPVLLTLFMNNTLWRQHTKAPLAALSTSSYELVIVCSIDLDPGSLLRQVVMTSLPLQNLRGCMSRPVQINEGLHYECNAKWLVHWLSVQISTHFLAINYSWISHLGYKSKNFHSVLNLLLKFWWNFKLHQALLCTYYFISKLSV